MANINNFNFPYLFPPLPPHGPAPHPSFPPPPHGSPPPSHPISPPPPHHPLSPPPPPHHPHSPPPPPRHPLFPPPPHHPLSPPPLPPTPSPHPTIIIIVIVSCGGLFLLAFLALGLCCFMKKKKTVEEVEHVHVDEHLNIKEAIVPGPHGNEVAVLQIEEDIHVDEEIIKKEKVGKGIMHHAKAVEQENTGTVEAVAGTTSTSGEHHDFQQKS